MPSISRGWARIKGSAQGRSERRNERGRAKADAYVATKFSLIPSFRRKPKVHKGKHPQSPLDYFYTAKAEAKRQRRRRRRMSEALAGGWGPKAQQLAMEMKW